MLYIFAGFPGKQLAPGSQHISAGGLQYAIETVEELAELEHSDIVQYRKEGVFVVGTDELLYPVEYRISDMCQRDGITWDWFKPNMCFGNSVVVHKTLASPQYQTVVHGTDLNLDQFLEASKSPVRLEDIALESLLSNQDSWERYEARWLPGTCPQESHVVHLTWIATTHRLPEFAYERIRQIIEESAEPIALDSYPTDKFSTSRRFEATKQGGT